MTKKTEPKEEFARLFNKINDYYSSLGSLKKYSGNKHYKEKIRILFLEINHQMKKIERMVDKDKYDYLDFFELVKQFINKDDKIEEKQKLYEELQLKWQDLTLDLDNFQAINNSHSIPKEIPFTDVRLDLEEAIRDLNSGCFLSAIVMCRRAYEGALISKYKLLEKKEPIKQVICKNCKNVLKGKVFFGIVELHKWAIDKKIISEKFKDIGFLIPNLGAGGAHPSDSFPRDPDVANISITTTIALLKQLYSS